MSLIPTLASATNDISRTDLAKEFMQKYQIEDSVLSQSDPDFFHIYNNLIYGDVLSKLDLSDRLKGISYITTIVSLGITDKIYDATNLALKLGVSALEIKDLVYQCAAYIGIEKVRVALPFINKAMLDNNIKLPLKSTATTNEDTRFDVGKKIQVNTYGERLKNIHENTPKDEFYLQVYNLSAYCFGDFYSRSALEMKDRTLITVVAISTLGGQESQLRSHINTALKLGISKRDLLGALSVANPFIGYPRTLTALGIIREESKKIMETK